MTDAEIDKKTQEYVDQISNQANNASGPDKYVIRTFHSLIRAMADVEKSANGIRASVDKAVLASEKVENAVTKFEKSTNKTELVMMMLAATSIVLAAVQVWIALRSGLL